MTPCEGAGCWWYDCGAEGAEGCVAEDLEVGADADGSDTSAHFLDGVEGKWIYYDCRVEFLECVLWSTELNIDIRWTANEERSGMILKCLMEHTAMFFGRFVTKKYGVSIHTIAFIVFMKLLSRVLAKCNTRGADGKAWNKGWILQHLLMTMFRDNNSYQK
jgi:hypothetical protein